MHVISRALVPLGLSVIFGAQLSLSGCAQQIPGTDLKSPEASQASGDFGFGAPSWITQADYEGYVRSVAKEAERLGIADAPPSIVRWIRPDEWAVVKGQCLAEQGLSVQVDEVRGEVSATAPTGQENLEEYAWWVCDAKYPQMPDSEHGVFSERTKQIMYEWASKDLVACLESEGFREVTDIPSYEVFWELYDTQNPWHPYNWDVWGFGRAKGIDIEAKCPQWPNDGRLDYQYHEEK
jgi:hypothetical protein